MKRNHETCKECGTALKTARQQARGICASCDRSEVTK